MRLYKASTSASEQCLIKAKQYAGMIECEIKLSRPQREDKAIRFAKLAFSQGNDEARIFLAEAWLEGKGYISPNITKYLEFYMDLANCGNQNAAFELGCMFLCYEVDGKKLLIEDRLVQCDATTGLNYMSIALKGSNISLLKATIRILNLFFKEDIYPNFPNVLNHVKQQLNIFNNPYLALFLAYAYCPFNVRYVIDKQLENINTKLHSKFKHRFHFPEQFDEYIKERSIEKTKAYLKMASTNHSDNPEDTLCKRLAKLFSNCIDSILSKNVTSENFSIKFQPR